MRPRATRSCEIPEPLNPQSLNGHRFFGFQDFFGLEAGMDDYIAKPVQIGELAEVLKRCSQEAK
jgi:CheY-like chemotaxis protein